ncbi:MAG: T9SS type A sorting domain-containing protein [Ignavibacteria bacterium]|nr:T9SS type A sorting domain-containing protein [Ignavibacteria bacterium]
MEIFNLTDNLPNKLASSGSHDIFIKKFSPVERLPNQSIFLTYPNPSTNFINLDLTKTIIHGNLKIFNILGQLVFEKDDFNGDSFNFDTSNLSSSVYLIYLLENELTYHAMFIKN